MADNTPDLARPQSRARTVTGWTIFFMVLLRISIGWHFAYEGAWKLAQPDWRATGYLLQSAGPLRPVFLWMVEDPNGLERLTPESVKERIDERFDVWVAHFNLEPLSDEQIERIQDPDAKAAARQKKELYENLVAYRERKKTGDPDHPEDTNYVDAVFADPDFQQQLEHYKKLLASISEKEAKLGTMEFNKERLVAEYGQKAQLLNTLLGRAEAPLVKNGILDTNSLEGYLLDHLTEAQWARGPAPPEKSQTWLIDHLNMWALTAVGVCLMLGLFTRLAALGGVGLLVMYYMAIPPWPWLPDNPMAEGHYWFIDKNFIEAIALLMIATSRVGRWAGLDAWVSRLGKCGSAEAEAAAASKR